jgi:hypothetical protein
MSRSPLSRLPFPLYVRDEPREPWRLPVPLDVGHVCVAASGVGDGALSTAARFNSPLPFIAVRPRIALVLVSRSAFT